MNSLFLFGVLILSLLVHAKQYRFDYDWSEQAEGWLKYHAVPAVWDEARLRCHAEGAVLASPLTRQLKTAVISFVKNQKHTTSNSIFTGVHATFSKGDYSSIKGVPLLRLAITWAPGEPNNLDNSESCLSMTTNYDGFMSDIRCSEVLPYVCYKKETQLDMTECGTTDREYILSPRTGSCYKFHARGLVWSQAYMTCVGEGGHLAVINDDVEVDVIKDIFSKHPDKKIFSIHKSSLSIGFHDWGSHGARFMTIHGEDVEVKHWPPGEPDNVTSVRTEDLGQYCGSIFRSGLLDDYYCNVPAAFLCEKSPGSLLQNY